jgi:hypothetical protein
MALDFNTAGAQRSFDTIPEGTIAVVQLKVRPGNAGEGGWLKRTKNGDAEGIDAELTVVEGEYAKRKFWAYMLTGGETDGHSQAADITTRRLRAVIESARGIKPTDVSEAAKQARCATSYADFDGVRFMCRIGVEPARGEYKAKNILGEVITPDRKEWRPIEQEAKQAKPDGADATPAGTSVQTIRKPEWAR